MKRQHGGLHSSLYLGAVMLCMLPLTMKQTIGRAVGDTFRRVRDQEDGFELVTLMMIIGIAAAVLLFALPLLQDLAQQSHDRGEEIIRTP